MNNSHPISNEVLAVIDTALTNSENWLAYNNSLYFIGKKDIHFFKDENVAKEFAANNKSDKDNFCIIRIDSIQELFRQIPYEAQLSSFPPHDSDINGLYNRDGNVSTDALIDHIDQQNLSLINSQLKLNIMNNENLQYLSDNIKYMGFGENLKADLEKNINEGKGEFQLNYRAEINKKPFEATLNFRKSDTSDIYFFNNYHASLEKTNGEKIDRTFFLNKGKGITAKEAFNLLDGRAVHKDLMTKDGQPYKAWTQLDFEIKDKNDNFGVKQFHENYGFDLKAAVEKFSITDLKEPNKEKALMQSLQKGNVQSVTIEKDGSSHKMFIEADPQFKKVNLYDSNMKLVAKESVEKYQSVGQTEAGKTVKEEMGNDKKKELKQEVKPETAKVEKKNDKTLLPKKRERSKKGLGVA